MAHSFAIDEHMGFTEDATGTQKMFERERRSRERYNRCLAENTPISKGLFFEEN